MAKRSTKKVPRGRTEELVVIIRASAPIRHTFMVGTQIPRETLEQQGVLERLMCDCQDGECKKNKIVADEVDDGMIGIGIWCHLQEQYDKAAVRKLAEEQARLLSESLIKFGLRTQIRI